MKTLQEIKDEYAKDMSCSNYTKLLDKLTFSGEFEEMEKFNDEVSKRFAIEVAKESLRLRFQENNSWADSSAFNVELPSDELKYIPKI